MNDATRPIFLRRGGVFRNEREANFAVAENPSDWFTSNACTGNCFQGRACDCVEDVPAVEVREPLGYRMVLWVASVIGIGLIGAMLLGFVK